MVVLETYWRNAGLIFEASLGSFTLPFQFNRMWTASHYPAPSENNQVLLSIIWLRKYRHVDMLSLWFLDIDPSSVVRIVYKVFPELWRYFQNQVSWPTLPKWRTSNGNRERFPYVVGAIDTTLHEIYRPLIEL